MNEKALQALEYHKIIRQLAQKADSEPGRTKCMALLPSSDINQIESMQQQTSDALQRLFQKGSVSFVHVKDIQSSLKRLDYGSTLNPSELLTICELLENAGQVKSYGRPARQDQPADCLSGMFQALEPLPSLTAQIRRCILSEEEISDDASPGLRRVRHSMKSLNDKIHAQLTSMLNGSTRTYLQDAVITMRDDRYCIPVKTEYKGQVPGMIHDQSASGSTLYIEPMSVVKLNNDMRQLMLQEQKEIDRILADLSQETAVHSEELTNNFSLMAELDFIFARALLAMEQNATCPIFHTKGRIHLRKARHPLIHPKQVVPIDVELGEDFDLLIVTGPNTGGKTVSLKMVGLLTLMGQAGLHIPAADRSELSVFTEVYADIGDEQSIEQSLSTFSSHMTNIVSFIEKADADSLVLLDELGAGTDPTEGAALAIAILSCLHEQGIRTMATTHYSELKVYAIQTPGVENASCEFDVNTLQPTYHLQIGVPGKSNAFAISSRLGLPASIIDQARDQISQQDESFEDMMASLETSRVNLEKEQTQIAQYKLEVEKLKKDLEEKESKIDQRKDKILQDANEEAEKVLQDAKDYADETIKLYRRFQKDHVDLAAMEQERQRLRQKMEQTQKQKKPKKSEKKEEKKPARQLTPDQVQIGDAVRVVSLNMKGTICSTPDQKGNVYVQMGILRSQVPLSDLELLEETEILTPSHTQSGQGNIKFSKSASVSPEINLLGKTVDEAIAELDKYLDDAYLAHLSSVRIVHGKGTGALRKGVQNFLKRQKYVDSFRLGAFGEGDSGVTIVEFKK